MRLIISETTVQDATIPIRWCLERKELEELKRREVKNPHLLLAIVHKEGEEDRYLVPLDQMLVYIQFHRPGENRIMATVVWPSSMLELKKYFLGRGDSDGRYEKNVLEYDRKTFNGSFTRLNEETEVTLVVPAELFAKEPPAWEKWWVNWGFETKPRDQCQYRKRRMIAYTIQPPIVLFIVIFLSICRILAAGTLLFLGKRKVDLRPIIHPFLYHNSDVWQHTEASVFLRDGKGERRHWLNWLVTFFEWKTDWEKAGLEADRRREVEKVKEKRRKEEQQQAELEQLLICNGEFTPSLRALPKEKQTVYLRFQDLKAKVCKPYAQ